MATLTIHTDIDCNIYIDTELHGIAKAETNYAVELPIGAYWIKCTNIENENDCIEFDFRAATVDLSKYYKVELLPIRFSRLVSCYDSLSEFKYGFAEAFRDGKILGYVNRRGDFVDSKSFDKIVPFGENILWVKKDSLWGILDERLNYIIEPQFTAIELIDSELAIFFNGEKYGLINMCGEIIVPSKYSNLYKIAGTNLFCCALNNKYGIINFDGCKITPLKYDSVKSFSEGYIKVEHNGLWGFIDESGNEIIPCKYINVQYFSENLAAVCIDYKWGYIDRGGNEVIPCIYQSAGKFSDGVAHVYINPSKDCFIDKLGNSITLERQMGISSTSIFIEGKRRVSSFGKWGFIDTAGNEIVPCEYDNVQNFSEGRAAVEIKGKWGFIDEMGKLVISCIYSPIEFMCSQKGWSGNEVFFSSFKEGLAAVSEYKAWVHYLYSPRCCGYIDVMGNTVIPFKYKLAKSFSRGLAAVMLDKKWGYIDKDGNVKIPFIFDVAEDFDLEFDGLARVKKDSKWGFINQDGEEIISCIYDEIGAFSEYSGCMVKVKKYCGWGFLNKMGDEIIPCQYNDVKRFSEDIAAVNRHGRWGYIDKTGREIIPCIYDEAENFGEISEELAKVKLSNKYGVINKAGVEVVPCIYWKISRFYQGLSAVRNDDWGFINKAGKLIVPCKYRDVGYFVDGLAWVRIGGIEKFRMSHDGALPMPEAKYGLVDRSGKLVAPCVYDSIVYKGDCYRVGYGGEWDMEEYEKNLTWREHWTFRRGRILYIDKTGKQIAEETNLKWDEEY